MKVNLGVLLLLLHVFCFSNAFGQNPLSQNSLVAVKSEQITDQQLMEFVSKAKSSGLSEDQVINLAMNRGMASSEVTLLKSRITKLQIESPKAVPSNVPVIEKNPDLQPNSELIKTEKTEPAKSVVPGENIYGHQFFRNNSFQTFEKGTDAKAPDDYIIGVGDEFALSVFGYSEYNEVTKVDLNGFIRPKILGPINVKGIPYNKARDMIKARMSNFFDLANNQVTITISYSRIITINIVGEVDKPGSYKMPAVNTAFNALIAVGGPSNLGTVRNIQVKRGGKLVKTLDVYQFLSNPNSKQDFFLQDNDYILIPPAGKIVGIKGEVKRPMSYELLPNENLNELIGFAGSLTSKAYKQLFSVSRLNEEGTQRQILNHSLDSLSKFKRPYLLKDGDSITIFSKVEEIFQVVNVQGSVLRPGEYQLIEGDRVSGLIRKADGLRQEAKLDKAFLIRTKTDLTKEYISIDLQKIISPKPDTTYDLLLQKGDLLQVASSADFVDSMNVQAVGLFRKPGKFEYHNGMTLGDLLFLAGGLRMEADVLHVEITRISFFQPDYKPGDESRTIVKILEVGKDETLNQEQLDFTLAPYDEIFVRMVPDFEYQTNISVTGEVKYPGIYALSSKEEHINDIIKRAGGLNKYSFPEGATLYRPTLPGGYIVMNLKESLKSNKSNYNFILKPGDVLNIPRMIDIIAIKGSVQYLSLVDQPQVNTPYVAGKRAKYYINEYANGFSKESWKRKTYVIDNNSKVSRTKSFFFFKIYPKVRKGSTIYVINKPVKEKKLKEETKPVDWNKTIGDFTVKLTGIATLYVLLKAAGAF